MADFLLQHGHRRRIVVVFLAAFMAAAGLWSFFQLYVEAYPDMSDLQVTVFALFPGHAPEEVEQQVAVPLERALNSVPNVISRRSRSIFGLAVLDLTFAHGVDQNVARQQVFERLQDAELPEGVTAAMAPPTTPAGELYRYVLNGEGLSRTELRELQDWVIAPRLLQVPGVGDAVPFGGLVKQYQIHVDPMALYKYGLTIQDIAEAVGENNRNAGGALLPSGQQALVVRGIGLLRSPQEIESVVVTAKDGTPVFVRDVGRVEVSHAPRSGIFGIDDADDAVEGFVVMRRGENPSEVLKGILAAVDELNASPLLKGARIVPIYDRTELVNSTLKTVSRTLLEALVIVLLILVFFLGSLRAALLAALTIPLSLLFAFLCMKLAGLHASLLSLGAIDFGIIVDGTLVMVECIVRGLPKKSESVTHKALVAAVAQSTKQVRSPIFFSMVILIAAYLPLFTLERVERRLFMPMAFTIASALLGAMIFTLTLVPVLATYVFPAGLKPWRNPVFEILKRGYESALRVVLRHAWKSAAVTVLLVAMGLGLWTRLGTEFLPTLDEGMIWIRASVPPGSSLETSAQFAGRVRDFLRQYPQVRFVSSQTGRHEANTEPFGPNRNEFLIGLAPYSTWPPGMSRLDLTREFSQKLPAAFPGATFNVTQPIIDMVMESITGSSADLAVILSGPDLSVLRAKAQQVLELLRSIPGSADTAIEQEADQPQLRIEVNRMAAARFGINVADVQEVIEMAIGGKPVSTMFEGDRRFDIVVRYVSEARSTVEGIESILVPSRGGARIPLGQIARVNIANGATLISRRDNQRMISVRTNIRGRDQGSFAAEAQKRFRAEVQLPPGYQVQWGGVFENLTRASRRLSWVLPATVGIIFMILYWACGSVRRAFLILACVPFSIVGGVAALYLRGIPFSVSAGVGFVSLFGVAVMSGVLIVFEIQRYVGREGYTLDEAIITGAITLFRARLTLLLVAMLGILPAAMATGIGSDIQRPLATVIFGGLISTLLLSFIAIPVFYRLMEAPRASH
ncbi:MAG: CusA/CzcA family heavy metal efflux RND transporter [Bryobacteraceae bacterium]|nr:CusA/CzcA family heavy metal efflux RND transporter [Bryobacteraceae bacterium]